MEEIISNIWNFFQDHWQAGIQIFLLTVLLYWIMRAMHRTRGLWYIISLLGTVLFLSLVFRACNMPALEKLFGGFLRVMPVLIVVLFKEELRKLMEQTYKFVVSKMIFKRKEQRAELVDAICASVERMSRTRTGCLIAIEQKEDLSNWGENKGKIIDAEINADNGILESIFYKGGPLHDGGVIVRDGRVLAAACTFPLCEDTEIQKTFGTRHQAGVGFSEAFPDALVIIVSEETGNIHYVRDGHMYPTIRKIEDLNNFLSGRMNTEDVSESGRAQQLQLIGRSVAAWFKKEQRH